LMKLLSGAYQGDQGEIYLNGQRVVIENPVHGKELGIHCVYQEVDTALVPSLTVGENLFLDCLPLIINWKTLFREAEEVLQKLNFPLDPKRKIDSLTLVEKQMVLLAKAFMQNAKIMIFDEPTAPLSGPETKILLQQICNLKEKGVGIIFISHRLQEVFALCDTLSVLRNGQLVLNRSVSATSPEVVVEAMFGEKRADGFVKN
ncbi:MAG TPA: ABC transporter, partial [Paenibacillaceae bacterium]|nr:ABC transporter [Paenibacillaceae bacterium]